MRITIRQKNLEMTPALNAYIERKIIAPVRKLIKRQDSADLPILEIDVERTTKHHHKGEVYLVAANLTLNGTLLRGQATDSNVRAACDKLENELKREITGHKAKAESMFKKGARVAKESLRTGNGARNLKKSK
ncbi:MAG: ribosome-associated translation inhibitor RaiA [Candidatus Sungbacteria bacterium]|nr:ribosome-associated translation inhibitor RaiA [Candidatus Sungbacteria bacterium]